SDTTGTGIGPLSYTTLFRSLAPGPILYLVANATLVLLGVGMVATLVARAAQNLSRLAREEPYVRTPHTSHLAATRRLGISASARSEEHTSELQSPCNLVCRL